MPATVFAVELHEHESFVHIVDIILNFDELPNQQCSQTVHCLPTKLIVMFYGPCIDFDVYYCSTLSVLLGERERAHLAMHLYFCYIAWSLVQRSFSPLSTILRLSPPSNSTTYIPRVNLRSYTRLQARRFYTQSTACSTKTTHIQNVYGLQETTSRVARNLAL